MSVGHDGVVQLVAQAGEVAPGLQFVVADEVGELVLSLPLIHQLRDEVDAGLHGEDEAGLQGTGQTQALESELGALPVAVEVADILLAEVLHVMDVQPHHVTEAAREEQGVGSDAGSLGGVAFHQSEGFHAFADLRGGGEVGVAEGHSDLQGVHGGVERGQVDLVDGLLTFREALAYRHRRRQVASVVRLGLGTGIQQEDVTFLQLVDEAVVVEHLSLHRGDGGESQGVAVAAGHLFHGGGHLGLMDPGTHGAVCCQVHLRAEVHALLDEANLLQVLVVALCHDGFDKRNARARGLGSRFHA